jgi:hypothetical protein
MAAGSTYTPIATTTLGSAAASFTFSTISSSYTDLRIVINGLATSSVANINMRYNGDSTSGLYSFTTLSGDGSSAVSDRGSSANQMLLNYYGYMDTTLRTNVLVDIFQYASASVFKTGLSRANNAANGVAANVVLWRNTAAITSITFIPGAGNFDTGSTFTLYGIAAA